MSLGNSNIHQRGEIPEITKLPNGRIRVVRRFEKFTREDVDNANLGSLLGDFGDLDTAGEQITNQGYTNCRLISVEVDTRVNSATNTENPLLVQTYETLTNQFVEITDPIVEIQKNGLAKITKTYRAISGTTPPRKIGVNAAYVVTNPTNRVTVTASEGSGTYLPNANFTKWIRGGDDPEQYVFQNTSGEAISSEWVFYDVLDGNPLYSSDTNGYLPWEVQWPAASGISFSTQSNSTVYGLLASSELEDTTAFAQLTEVYLEAGIISETIDNVGSQKAKVIETIGADPSTPSGYSLASKQESDFEGFQTNRFTFLKNNVVLSESEDKVGSQLAIVQEVFNGTPVTPSGYSIANEQVSDFEGIPTRRYTFLKDNVELSRSEDKVGSQLAITTQVFNPTSDPTESGYSLAREEVSDVDGIPTKRYTFLKENVELSRSEDKVGSQLAITTEIFKPSADPVEAGYSVARTEVSDVDGIPTKRFTFLKNNVVLSVSEDKVGSQKAVVNEVFNPTSEAITGIDTSGTALAGYSEANRTESDYDGIKTIRVQFLKPSILSLQQDFNNGLKRVSVQAFGMTDANVSGELAAITTSHELMSQTESDFEGIKTSTFQYQIDETFTEDYELNGLKRISLIELSTTNFTAISIGSQGATATPQLGLYLATQDIDNGGIIKVRKSTWLESGQISKSEAQGPDGLPDTKTVTYVSQITEPTSSGILLSKNIDNTGGYRIYNYKYLEGATAGSTPIGTLQSYQQIIEVRKAGSVTATGGSSVSLPYITSIPPRIGKVRATVSIELTSSNTVSVPVAYNLSNTSCSATTVNTKRTPVGVEQGGSLTVAVYNTRQSTSHQPFSNYYATNTGDNGSITTAASIVRDNDNIIGETLNEVSSTAIALTGSNAAPATTGLYDQILDPVFIDASGTQFYRKTSYTIS